MPINKNLIISAFTDKCSVSLIRININFIYQNSSFCLSKSTICTSLFLTGSLTARQLANRLRRRFCTSASILSIVQINLRRNLASWRRSGRERTLIGLGGEHQAQPSKNTILMQNQKFNLHFRECEVFSPPASTTNIIYYWLNLRQIICQKN